MTLPVSGQIKFSQLQSEFGGTNPISLSEYYRGALATQNNVGVPTSGTIDMTDFYGGIFEFQVNITSSVQNANLYTISTGQGWNGTDRLGINIGAGVYLWASSTANYGATIPSTFPTTPIKTIYNSGRIMGKGGAGGMGIYSGAGYAGAEGGKALRLEVANVVINNLSGAYIAGGGGGGGGGEWYTGDRAGGGGGAGGGDGGPGDYDGYKAPGVGGAIGQSGTSTAGNAGGGAGGSGGGGGSAGAGGGRILPGVGGVAPSATNRGGNGGSAGSVGGNHASGAQNTSAGAGGGGWAARGGTGGSTAYGAGAAAISATTTYTLNNSGTVYGGV